jgi:hypothetical protein
MTIIGEDPAGSGEYTLGGPDPLVSESWALPADVLDVTGVTADVATISRAVATLETMTGLIEGVSRPDMTDRDRHYLKLATCYQVAFMADNPDLFSRADVTSASQDGESATFRNVDAHILAPLARKSIRKLSWRQPTRRDDRADTTTPLNVLSEEYDDSLPWQPA